jgi:hypothetical protein
MAIPMPVILLGAIGEMVHSGIVGFFSGTVVLGLGYQLLMAGMDDGTDPGTEIAKPISAAAQ